VAELTLSRGRRADAVRAPAVAGAFYPADPARLRALVARQLDEAARRYPTPPALGEPRGLLVPHAGLEYSGIVAAAAWRLLVDPGSREGVPTVVILGTNHLQPAFAGVGAWAEGSWSTPLGTTGVDADLAAAFLEIGAPCRSDREVHRGEHSIEVQLPFLQVVAPRARIVPLAIATGSGAAALDVGERLGEVIAGRRDGNATVLAISTDVAHYPPRAVAEWVTGELVPALEDLDAVAVHAIEASLRGREIPGLTCGMCGIEPVVVGLATLRAMGATRGLALAAATSADAGGPPDRAVGYVSVAFD
jgi:AmmeMemoRadiSam system protein B